MSKKTSGGAKKPATIKPDQWRLRRARTMVSNVLWNLEHNPEEPCLRDPAAWRRVFENLQETLG